MLTQSKQMTGKLEEIEGTLETLTAADAKTKVFGAKFKSDPEKLESNPERISGCAQPSQIGKISADLGFWVEIRGSGVKTTDPDWVKYYQCCGNSSALLKSIDIGAVTSGPFLHNEVITGAGGGQGRVVMKTANGAAKIYYVAVGTIEIENGETITGGTSGATATTASVPASAGRVWRPIIEDVPTLSDGLNQDGYLEKLAGGRGNAKISINAGGKGIINFAFKGANAGQSGESFLTGVAYEETDPPVFKSGTVTLDAYTPGFSSLEIDLGVQLAQREDPTKTSGILSYALTNRKITGTLVIDMILAAVYDLRAKQEAKTEVEFKLTWGTTPSQYILYFPRIQFLDIDKGDKDGLVTATVQFQANGSLDQNDDFAFIQL